MQVNHEPEQHRFVARVDGSDVVLEYAKRGDGVLEYRHTYTPPALRGQGIAKHVVLFALEYARANGIRVIPTCPYVAKIIQQNPSYATLIAEVR